MVRREVICNTNALGHRLILEDLAAAKEKYGLNLLAKQSLLPKVMKSMLDRKKVIGGFLNAGFIDSNKKKWPDFDSMLRIAGTKPTPESYDLILSSFPKLHKEQLRKGRLINRDDFIPNLFPEDKYPFGAKPVDRDFEYESY